MEKLILVPLILALGVNVNSIKLVEPKTEVLSYRLPNNSLPISYDIKITSNIHKLDFNFLGEVRIHVKILEPTQKVTLHSRKSQIEGINILTADGILIINDADYELLQSLDYLIIDLIETYQPGTELLIDISYRGVMSGSPEGFYYGNSFSVIYQGYSYYAATQFKINNARHALPCYDEPGFRTPMSLTLVHGNNVSAISNMEVTDTFADGDYLVTKFAATPAMPIHSLAFVISNFTYVNGSNSRIPQRIFSSVDEMKENQPDFAAGIVGRVLEKYEEIFEVKFPLNKMDHVAISVKSDVVSDTFGLGTYMIFGLIAYPWSPYSEGDITDATAEEFALQWFGSIVSPKWWSYSWLSEGMARFFRLYIQDLLSPNANAMRRFFTRITNDAFYFDNIFNYPMSRYVDDPSLLPTKFNEITTSKAPCIIRMFMEALSVDVFMKGINYYLKDNYMQTVTPDHLHEALQRAYDETHPTNRLDIGKMMSTWEEQAGYPLIYASISDSNLLLKQNKFYENSSEVYAVPLTIASKSDANFTRKTATVWLTEESMTIPLNSLGISQGDWIVLNKEQVGYYKVDYDLTLWNLIIQQLKVDPFVIHDINREILLSEFYTSRQQLDPAYGLLALDMISYLEKETVWRIYDSTHNLKVFLMEKLYGTNVYVQFKNLLQKITKPLLLKFGYENLASDSWEVKNFRNHLVLWNSRADDIDYLSRQLVKFNLFRARTGIERNDYVSFCDALKIVGNEAYIEILNEILDENLYYRLSYLQNMGCSLNGENLDALLEFILDTEHEMSPYDRQTLFNNVAGRNKLATEKSLKFIEENYLALSEVVGQLRHPLSQMVEAIKEEEMVVRFKALIAKLVEVDLLSVDYQEKYLQKIQSNTEWLERNYYGIRVFFGLEEATTTTSPSTSTEEPTERTTATIPTTTGQPDSGSSYFESFLLIVISLTANIYNFY